MDRTIQEILTSSKALLKGFDFASNKQTEWAEDFNKNWLPLNWRSKALFVLAPDGFVWSDKIYSFYIDETTHEIYWQDAITDGSTVIVHGHGRNSECFAKFQCHVYGYEPTGNEGPQFLARWEKRYGERIQRNPDSMLSF